MQNLNRIPLAGLRAVEAAGRLGSLRAAADELGVTIGAVSQQVQKTERQLGRTLFERLPKGIRPTPLGEEILKRLSIGMAELSAAVALAERRDQKVLTVSAAPVFAGKWLVWRLKRFNQRHPEFRVRIDANVALIDPSLSDVDVCIRVGWGDWPGVAADRILEQRVFPVCSPTMAEGLRDPADLGSVPIIRDPEAMFGWTVWLRPNDLDDSILGDGPVFSDASLCLDAAIAGQGVFLAWETLANDAIRMDRLAAPFPGRYRTGISYWFVTAQNRANRSRIRAFRAWLEEELSASVPLHTAAR
jgi:DNA-binding transcriptional LysR family regulator